MIRNVLITFVEERKEKVRLYPSAEAWFFAQPLAEEPLKVAAT